MKFSTSERWTFLLFFFAHLIIFHCFHLSSDHCRLFSPLIWSLSAIFPSYLIIVGYFPVLSDHFRLFSPLIWSLSAVFPSHLIIVGCFPLSSDHCRLFSPLIWSFSTVFPSHLTIFHCFSNSISRPHSTCPCCRRACSTRTSRFSQSGSTSVTSTPWSAPAQRTGSRKSGSERTTTATKTKVITMAKPTKTIMRKWPSALSTLSLPTSVPAVAAVPIRMRRSI